MARKTVEIVPTPAGLSGYTAELGSAFLCADLGIATAPRPDHASYIAHWLKVLKDDKKAVFTAASQADKAARYLFGFGELTPPIRPAPDDASVVPSRPTPHRRPG